MTDNNKLYYGIGIGIAIVVMIALIPFTAKSDDIYFVNSGGSGVVGNLTDLGDVMILSPSTNEYLYYNGTHWINSKIPFSLTGLIDAAETKTNIGTTYVDIPTGCGNFAFAWDCLVIIDCVNSSDLLIFFIWDYVGTGSHSVRWVDYNNQNNVLIEVTGITQDQFIGSSNIFSKPSWCTSSSQAIKMQGKSTVATDSPVSYGYEIRIR